MPDDSLTPPVPVISIKGSPAWKAWLDALSRHCRMPKAVLIDVALAEYAAKIGFEPEPPPRQD